jgi:hypothetical protein
MLMSFADPLLITIGGVTSSLPRISVGDDTSEYQSGDGLVKLSASHTYGKRTRRLLRVDTSKMTADPFRPAENVQVSMSNYLVFDLPKAGFTPAEANAVWQGFKTLIIGSSDLMIVKLLGGES